MTFSFTFWQQDTDGVEFGTKGRVLKMDATRQELEEDTKIT